MREGSESRMSLCYPRGLGASPQSFHKLDLRTLAEFQESEMSPGLSQDLMDEYIKLFKTSSIIN